MDASTSDPEVHKESVGDLALKTCTLYFLVTATILGVLFFAAIRKASKICCWNFMYGSKYIRDQKEDPRVPATLFKTPSILNTLQDRYDKSKSSIRSKSDAASYSYVKESEIEMGDIGEGTVPKRLSGLVVESEENSRIHRYLDSMDNSSGDNLGQDNPSLVPDEGKQDETEVFEDTLKKARGSDKDYELEHDAIGAKDVSDYDSLDEYKVGTSQPHESHTDINENESDYTFAGTSTSSQGSFRSTTSDGAPLVSMDPTGKTSIQRGRYKKHQGAASSSSGTGISTGTASAKSSRRASRLSDRY